MTGGVDGGAAGGGPSVGRAAPPASAPARSPRRGAALLVALAGGAAAATALNVLAVQVYDALTDRDGIADLDRPALRVAQRLRTPVRDAAAAVIAVVFGPVGMPVVTGAAALAVSRRPRRPGWFFLVAATGVGSLVVTVSDKELVKRNRPPRRDAIRPYESSPSFPSGHTLNATALTGVLAWLEARRRGARHPLTVAFATAAGAGATVGASRVLLGAHWLTDVVFAWLAGLGWLTTVITADRIVGGLGARR